MLETEEEAGAVLVEAGGRLIVTEMVLLQPGEPVEDEHEEEVEFEVVGGCC